MEKSESSFFESVSYLFPPTGSVYHINRPVLQDRRPGLQPGNGGLPEGESGHFWESK